MLSYLTRQTARRSTTAVQSSIARSTAAASSSSSSATAASSSSSIMRHVVAAVSSASSPARSTSSSTRSYRSSHHQPSAVSAPLPESNESVDDYYGELVFDKRTMTRYLSKSAIDKLNLALSANKPVDYTTADAIANALLRWATERGATHYTHWFQPITGTCAEKHDTFIDTTRDGETPLVRFTGKQLIMGEPDGSSFPTGGLRATHIARGYTAWDPHSPPFILHNNNGATLYIPSCFFSWDSAYALDEKIPLLRSEEALSRECMRLFQIIGEPAHTRVHMDSGLEQEFFLIDRRYFVARPDLMLTGRTVLGASPSKGQELEDSYFGPMAVKFLDCIHEFEVQCWKLGIPIQTRHREVAPGQYEVAPKFAPGNVATDRNLILMEVLKRTARKHNLAALLHEKPFKGVNGSGKHNNWSLGTNEVPSLLDPGLRAEKNQRFMFFLAATLRAVDLHADLMRVAISGPSNDHRLGANEAPPAIVSAYLGDDIEQSVDRYISDSEALSTFDPQINLGVQTLPTMKRAPTDRNRTSTFAFTGNKFEFRAVGSSHNAARSSTVLNTIVAQSLKHLADEIQALKTSGVSIDVALKRVTQETLVKHRRIIFNGNGYSKEWEAEAEQRGLPNLKTTPVALDTFYSPKNVELFESMKVLSREELQARQFILFEDYTKKILIEGRVLAQMALTQIAPIAFETQTKIAASIMKLEELMGVNQAKNQRQLLDRITKALDSLLQHAETIKVVCEQAHEQGSPQAGAHFCLKQIVPLMAQARAASDELESIIPAKDWPLPTYHQMMFFQD